MKTTTLLSTSLLGFLTVALLAGCSPESASMTVAQEFPQPTPIPRPHYDAPADQQFNWVKVDGGQRELEAKPAVDILFVVDNSDSMRSAQSNLVRNIHKFSGVIGKNKMIDYHIGVISVWDYSKRFTENRPDGFSIGDLRPVKDASGHPQGKKFVTRDESPLLAPTLNIGVQALKDGGPENEEVFAPLAAALDKSGNGAPNDGFFRPEAQLVVIFMTDADEPKLEQEDYKDGTHVTRLSVRGIYEKLVSFKGGNRNKVSAYGVLVPQNAADTYKDYGLRVTPTYHPECFDMNAKPAKQIACFDGFGPAKLESLIMMVNAQAGSVKQVRSTYIKSITRPDFGDDLTEIGAGISQKIMEKVVALPYPPYVKDYVPQIKVRYGTPEELAAGKGQVIPKQAKGGWMYIADTNSVVLAGDIAYEYKENARYEITMVIAPQ